MGLAHGLGNDGLSTKNVIIPLESLREVIWSELGTVLEGRVHVCFLSRVDAIGLLLLVIVATITGYKLHVVGLNGASLASSPHSFQANSQWFTRRAPSMTLTKLLLCFKYRLVFIGVDHMSIIYKLLTAE